MDTLPPGSEGVIRAPNGGARNAPLCFACRVNPGSRYILSRLAHMAGQAQSRTRIAHHQEIPGYRVIILNVWIMAAGALHVVVHLYQWIAGSAAAQTRHKIVVIAVQWEFEIEGMHPLQCADKQIVAGHRASHLDGAVGDGLSRRDRAIMTAKAEIAGRAQGRLLYRVDQSRAGVERVGRVC